MPELTEFILARIAEDEAAAQRATPGPWTSQGGGYVMPPTPWTGGRVWSDAAVVEPNSSGGLTRTANDNAAHIARHDPARVLAECAAIRAVVEQMSGYLLAPGDHPSTQDPDAVADDLARGVLEDLAIIWADHDDYRPEEWA